MSDLTARELAALAAVRAEVARRERECPGYAGVYRDAEWVAAARRKGGAARD